MQLEERSDGWAESCSKLKKTMKTFFPMCSGGDPDPQDPHVVGPPGSRSGSISQRYGSGSGRSGVGSGSRGRGTDPRIRIRTKMTRIPNTACVKLIFFVHIAALCGQAAAKIIMKCKNRLLAGECNLIHKKYTEVSSTNYSKFADR
jgi:hypothetical protein